MNFILENWYIIVAAICVVAAIIFAVVRFSKLSGEQKYETIRGWLLQAVILAEQEYGSGTGKMKLSVVYDQFCKTLPWIAKVLSFEVFSEYVDKALEEAKVILRGNEAIAALAETMIKDTQVGKE